MEGASHSESQRVILGGCRHTRAFLSSAAAGSGAAARVPLGTGRAPRAALPQHSERAGSAGRAAPLLRPVPFPGAGLSDLGSHSCGLRSCQGHKSPGDAADPSHAATGLEKPSWGQAPSALRSRPSLGNQLLPLGPAATGCSLAREFLGTTASPFFVFSFFLNNNCSHPSFLVVTHTDTHYMYTIWARGPTACQGSQHRSGWCTHSAAVKGEVVLLSFKLAMFVFILFFIF